MYAPPPRLCPTRVIFVMVSMFAVATLRTESFGDSWPLAADFVYSCWNPAWHMRFCEASVKEETVGWEHRTGVG